MGGSELPDGGRREGLGPELVLLSRTGRVIMSHLRVIREVRTMSLRQLTVRGFDKELEKRLWKEARASGVSLNQAALRLLRRGAGLDPSVSGNVVGSSLDPLIGTWSAAEEKAFRKAVSVFERVDKELWR